METCGTVMPSDAVSQLWDAWERQPKDLRCSAQSCLYRALFCDIAQVFPNFVLCDYQYLMKRFASEGSGVYLEKLPLLGKGLETSLITGDALIVPPGWQLRKGTRLPKFLYELFSQLYDNEGHLTFDFYHFSKDPRVVTHKVFSACLFLRQVTMMWSKVELFSDVGSPKTGTKVCAKSIKAIDEFVKRITDEVEIDYSISLHRDSIGEARRLLRWVFSQDLSKVVDLKDFVSKPWGRQGPGAVAGGERGKEKWSFQKWPGLPKYLFTWREGFDMDVEPITSQPPARLRTVPKDFRGPRVICMEPKENQFAQQGLMAILYGLSRESSLLRKSISFFDTAESRRLCFDYRYATIDMKDASDLISLRLARVLLPRWVFKLVTRYRSRTVSLPDQRVIKSRCLTTMGNATCFPLETFVFWAIALGTLLSVRDSYPERQRKHLNLDVRVFGDDIIVPLWGCDAVVQVLTACKMLVNTGKTCALSLVRESCGEWVFAGRSARIFKFRSTSVTSHRNFLQWRDQLNDLESVELPALKEEISDMLKAYVTNAKLANPRAFRLRYNGALQRMEIFAPVVVQTGSISELVDAAGLYAWHVHNDRTPFLRGARKRVHMRWQDSCGMTP